MRTTSLCFSSGLVGRVTWKVWYVFPSGGVVRAIWYQPRAIEGSRPKIHYHNELLYV